MNNNLKRQTKKKRIRELDIGQATGSRSWPRNMKNQNNRKGTFCHIITWAWNLGQDLKSPIVGIQKVAFSSLSARALQTPETRILDNFYTPNMPPIDHRKVVFSPSGNHKSALFLKSSNGPIFNYSSFHFSLKIYQKSHQRTFF